MGKYGDSLSKRLKTKTVVTKAPQGLKLVSCAIIRDGVLHSGFKSHAELRRTLRDEDPYNTTPGDQDGFMTSDGAFATRLQAIDIGVTAGQCHPQGRPLLSSDIHKW